MASPHAGERRQYGKGISSRRESPSPGNLGRGSGRSGACEGEAMTRLMVDPSDLAIVVIDV
ncbi:MAG: hypothetical protein ACRDJC_21255, partial [Thermomicrobiales bacterium]